MKLSSLLSVVVASALSFSLVSASEYTPVKEDWDYSKAMKTVTAKFTGTEGVVIHMGDSISYANQNTRWANAVTWNKKAGVYSDEDKEILKWSHAYKKKSNLNGWHLTSVDAAGGRSETSVSGITTGQYLKGGKRGIASAAELIKRYNPQIVILMLGTNDGNGKVPAQKAADNIETLVKMLLENGTIPVLSTIPPCVKFDAEAYNALYRGIAKKHSIPMIDLYKDMMALAGDNWKTQMLSSDGIHLSHKLSGAAPTKSNLANCGYLLRCWMAVQKLKEVRAGVIK
ncbi:MAG: SGNH/GDSL hydrolase family protein [Planctomycetes bacterium]|nr:SGNH/GDSL hydrolase family protein [Planctomycetota bacterium]